MSHEFTKFTNESESYLDFLNSVASKGPALKITIDKIVGFIKSGRTQIQMNSVLLFSVVSLGDGNHNTIFLPQNYDEQKATSELPRVLLETLQIAGRVPPGELESLGEKIRKELKESLNEVVNNQSALDI